MFAFWGYTVVWLLFVVASVLAEDRADHRHFFSSGLRGSAYGGGPTFSYGQRLNGRLFLNGTFFFGQLSESTSGGSLDNAQYYETESKRKSTMFDVGLTYFFRENGIARWGALLKAGVGHARTTIKSEWKRYDRDPAFIVIGDEKRLRESESDDASFDSTYARLSGGYQFLWGFYPGNRVGHVLELSAGVLMGDREAKVGTVQPNGESASAELERVSALFEIAYSVAF